MFGGDEAASGRSQIGNNTPGGVLSLLSTLCLELCKHNNTLKRGQPADNGPATSPGTSRGLSGDVETASPDGFAAWGQTRYDSSHDPSLLAHSPHARKRRRMDSCGNPSIELQLPPQDVGDAQLSTLPPAALLEDIVTVYFAVIQPWIPILHETRFRTRMRDPEQLPPLFVVIHGMIVSALRFAHPEGHALSAEELDAMIKRSRSIVVLNAMDSLTVENLQALIMIAFSDVSPVLHGTHYSRANQSF